MVLFETTPTHANETRAHTHTHTCCRFDCWLPSLRDRETIVTWQISCQGTRAWIDTLASLKVDTYSPTKHKMDSPCANPSEHLSIQPTPCPCLCLCSSVSLCVSVCLCVPGCLPLSVGFSFGPCVCVCLNLFACLCACLCRCLVSATKYDCWYQLWQTLQQMCTRRPHLL